jgi:hypothetical protein
VAGSAEPVPALLARQLQAGEQVYWVGRPDPRRVFELGDVFTLGFGVVWLAFVIFWMASAAAMGAPLAFTLFGIPFLLVGLYLSLGIPIQRQFQRARTRYAVTDRRVVTTTGERSMRAIELSSIEATSVTVNADGTGTLAFDAGLGLVSNLPAWALNSYQDRRGASSGVMAFANVAEVSAVQALVESLRQGLR